MVTEHAQFKDLRVSRNQIRSNPILASQRAFQTGIGRRDQERKQLRLLLDLQTQGVPLHKIPEMVRVDSSELQQSNERIGVVGLVVDNRGEGYVTQLQVASCETWSISVDLPFTQVHIQSLLLRVLGEQGIDDSLPELLSYRISDTLCDRSHGDSMDIACLLAIVDASVSPRSTLLSSAAAVVSPLGNGGLDASKSAGVKLAAFQREFGCGSLLVRHADDLSSAQYDSIFSEVWAIRDLRELAKQLEQHDLTHGLLAQVDLQPRNAFAIESQTRRLLASEATYGQASDFIGRLIRRANGGTPLRIQLEISYAEEDLHRHRGNFDAAIAAREKRVALESNPLISCYERAANSDNRHAASLYDAHRFQEAIDCLHFWEAKFRDAPKVCLPETRAILFNTLARCKAVMNEPGWEELFKTAIEIQNAIDPENVSRTNNFFAHAYLKFNRYEEAVNILNLQVGETDPFKIWLSAECSRQAGEMWDATRCESVGAIDEGFHVHGFACQAIARQIDRDKESRLIYLGKARRSFQHGIEKDVSNVKRVLSSCCGFAIAVASRDSAALDVAMDEFQELCAAPSFGDIKNWYGPAVKRLSQDRDWPAVETIFSRVPHL